MHKTVSMFSEQGGRWICSHINAKWQRKEVLYQEYKQCCGSPEVSWDLLLPREGSPLLGSGS